LKLRIVIIALLVNLSGGLLFAQQTEPCITEYVYQDLLMKFPGAGEKRKALSQWTEDYIKTLGVFGEQQGSVRYIPVVFHVIHQGGDENISKEQILDQLRILNNDFRRQNADSVNTVTPFKAVAADTQIEFRLARKDPNGNCSDGIVRVFSPQTQNAFDNVKALSFWDSDKYLNIWLVRTILNFTGSGGTILGYAYYPGTAPSGADGIVQRADYTGSIGSAATNTNKGRVLAHEVGHYLNLAHVWGDSNCGDDQVADTPVQQGPNNSCPTFPKISCNNGPDGDMYQNYMDYTNGSCQNLFSLGQKNRMDAVLAGIRSTLVSPGNATATGIFDSTGSCLLVPDFYSNHTNICSGDSVRFKDASWNGEPVTWNWSFPGGSPSGSNMQNPVVQYSVPGTYNVTLSVTNQAGAQLLTKNSLIHVYSISADHAVTFHEGFENPAFPTAKWIVENQGGKGWERTILAASSGGASFTVQNALGNVSGSSDIFYSPSFDFAGIPAPFVVFSTAFAQTDSADQDQLKVYATTDCGKTWSLRFIKSGTALASVPVTMTNFIPSPNEWTQQTMNLAGSLFGNKPNVRFRFEYFHVSGNNIYIDDLIFAGFAGLESNILHGFNFEVYPNPAKDQVNIRLATSEARDMQISITDVMGRLIMNPISMKLIDDVNEINIPLETGNGIYFIHVIGDSQNVTRKLIVSGN
jgi:PKD repeat protein